MHAQYVVFTWLMKENKYKYAKRLWCTDSQLILIRHISHTQKTNFVIIYLAQNVPILKQRTFMMAYINGGPALMAMWFKALPLTASCLSPLPRFESHPGQVIRLPVTWG